MARSRPHAITRRGLVAAAGAGVTSIAALALPAQALVALPEPDPALAAIAAHRAAYARLDAQCRALFALEQLIPKARRKAHFGDEIGTTVGTDDDPRWTAALAAWHAADDAETDAAWALAHLSPSTLAGAAALVRYAHDYADGGCDWPGLPEPDEDGDEDWYVTFHATLAAALERLGWSRTNKGHPSYPEGGVPIDRTRRVLHAARGLTSRLMRLAAARCTTSRS